MSLCDKSESFSLMTRLKPLPAAFAELFVFLGVTDGKKWLRKDQHEINHLRQLHCQRHSPTWSHK